MIWLMMGVPVSGGSIPPLAIPQAALEGDLPLGLGWRRSFGLALGLLFFLRGRGLPGIRQEGQRHLLDLRLDLEDADLDLLAGLDDIRHAPHPGWGQLGDVDESLDAGLELDEGAEVHDL